MFRLLADRLAGALAVLFFATIIIVPLAKISVDSRGVEVQPSEYVLRQISQLDIGKGPIIRAYSTHLGGTVVLTELADEARGVICVTDEDHRDAPLTVGISFTHRDLEYKDGYRFCTINGKNLEFRLHIDDTMTFGVFAK